MLNKNGVRWHESEWSCSEKKLIYELTKKQNPIDIGDKPKVRRVNKPDIFNIDSIHNLNTSLISYSTYSLADKASVFETKAKLLKRVNETAQSYLADVTILISHLK